MSQLKTMPVMKCKRCGKRLVVTHLSTAAPDPDGELLKEAMRMLYEFGLCDDCRKKRDWYMAHGRYEDWKKGKP